MQQGPPDEVEGNQDNEDGNRSSHDWYADRISLRGISTCIELARVIQHSRRQLPEYTNVSEYPELPTTIWCSEDHANHSPVGYP